jgi:bacterioferritin (cytochrome b1)
MENATSIGLNRTGAQMSPLSASSMETYAEQMSPAGLDDLLQDPGISTMRFDYGQEAEKIGSVPLPATLTGVLSTGVAKITGKNPEVLIDKLGERLAFERSGVRLYQALIDKVSAQEATQALPFKLADLEEIRDDEFEHTQILVVAIESIGADPTAQTPSADISGVASSGILKVLTDPRTNIGQSLTAVLTAELIDNASWDLLIRVAEESGQDELVPKFMHALKNEDRHASQVRDWLSRVVLQEAA